MAHCSVWSNATSAYQKNCKTTFPKCSLCSRTRASLEMISDRSCVSMPKNTTCSRSHASCLWVAFVVSRSCSPHHCYDGTSRMDSWWIECTKSSSTNLTPGLVRPDRRAHYFRHRSQWLPAERCDEHEDDYVCARIAGRPWTVTESCCFARKAFGKLTRGLFKVEWCGDGFVGLCSKTYYCFGATDKYSTKGLSKRHNDIDKDTFLAVLKNRRSGGGFNRGFRVRDSSVMTYIQDRAALTYFYGKRKVLADGLSTAPLEV